ncbi:MAG: SPOR domain-containing protein [Ignavibacteriaceae bacterium]
MKGTIIYSAFLILTSVLLASCSATQQTTQSKNETKDSLYVFDKVPVDTTKPVVLPNQTNPTVEMQNIPTPYYLIQIGAFTTQDRANEFVDKTQSILNQKVNISFNQDINLYVVRLAQIYSSHDDAEKVKNDLRQQEAFKDAWVVTVNK